MKVEMVWCLLGDVRNMMVKLSIVTNMVSCLNLTLKALTQL